MPKFYIDVGCGGNKSCKEEVTVLGFGITFDDLILMSLFTFSFLASISHFDKK